MANKKQLDYTQVNGYELVITKNPYGDKIGKMLEFYIHITKNENGQYVAYYFDKEYLTDDLDRLREQHIDIEIIKPFKQVRLVDVVPSYLPKHEMSFEKFIEWMCQSVETEYDMSGKYSAENKAKRKECGKRYGNNELNEWGEPTRYDCVKVFSTNQYKTNGWCA